MQRFAFKMFLNPGCEAEYRARHDAVWPELTTLLRKSGISNYSIYLDQQTGNLFAYLERQEDHAMDSLPESPLMRRWWHFMEDVMKANPDGSPVIVELEEMFYMR
jgi:L-rhamnose mutarotase